MWWQALFLTLQLMAVSVAISGVIGVPAAWAASSLQGCGRSGKWIARLFFATLVAAIATPMILHAAAWEATAGKFGWLPLTQTGSRSSGWGAFGAFGGLVACGWIHGLVGSSLVTLATWYGVRRVPAAVIGQACLDAGPVVVWWRVRLPMAMPWLVTSLLATAALAATEMTVVDLYGFRTIADEFYLFYATEVSVSAILITCFLPLLFTGLLLTAIVIWRPRMPKVNSEEQSRHAAEQPLSGTHYHLAIAVVVLVAALVLLVPISGLVIKAGHQVVVEAGSRTASWSIGKCFDSVSSAPASFAAEYQWTLLLAVMTGMTAVSIGTVMAAVGRTHRVFGRCIDMLSIAAVLIPGPIVGLGVVQFFQADIPGFRMLYQQTLVPTVIALLFRAAPVAYWVMRAGYLGIADSVFESARLDRSALARFWHIDCPTLKWTLVGALLASGIVASGDVPATLPVLPPGVTTVGTRLFGLLHSGARYQEAALALWYVAAVVTIATMGLKWGGGRRVRMGE